MYRDSTAYDRLPYVLLGAVVCCCPAVQLAAGHGVTAVLLCVVYVCVRVCWVFFVFFIYFLF